MELVITSKLRFILPWKHWEADDEVYCIEQRTYFVHYIPVNEFIVWELQKSTQWTEYQPWTCEKKQRKRWTVTYIYWHQKWKTWLLRQHWWNVKSKISCISYRIPWLFPEIKCIEHTTLTCSKFGHTWIFIVDFGIYS